MKPEMMKLVCICEGKRESERERGNEVVKKERSEERRKKV